MLRLFRVCTLLAAIAAAPLPSITWANGCSQGGNAICPLGDTGTGLLSSTLTPGTQAAPLAISGMLSSVLSGSLSAAQRASLNLQGDTGQAAAGGATRWNVWGALGQNQVAYAFQPVRSSGNINLVMGGYEYRWWQSAW